MKNTLYLWAHKAEYGGLEGIFLVKVLSSIKKAPNGIGLMRSKKRNNGDFRVI